MEGNKLYFEHWITEFNLLQETITIDKLKSGNKVDFMDFYIHWEEFYVSGKKDICFSKRGKQIYVHNK